MLKRLTPAFLILHRYSLSTVPGLTSTVNSPFSRTGQADTISRICCKGKQLASVRVALLLREEEKEGKVVTKASLRSSGDDSVRDVAAQFGGGGHKNAAGATIPMDAEQVMDALLPHIRAIWN